MRPTRVHRDLTGCRDTCPGDFRPVSTGSLLFCDFALNARKPYELRGFLIYWGDVRHYWAKDVVKWLEEA